MKNTKFRKRALLSSVAMLLVALVALGSATFAWFVANPTVSADGLQMTVVAAPGLKIDSYSEYTENSGWGFADSATLADTSTGLLPASPVLPSTATGLVLPFAQIKALTEDAITADTTGDKLRPAGIYTVASHNGTDFTFGSGLVYYEDLYFIKSSAGGSDVNITSVSVQIDNDTTVDISKGLKVALVAQKPTATAGTYEYQVIGVWMADGGTATTTALTNDDTAAAFSAQAATCQNNGASVGSLSIPVKTNANPASTSAGTIIRAYVYLDGQNPDVYSNKALSLQTLLLHDQTHKGITITVTSDA